MSDPTDPKPEDFKRADGTIDAIAYLKASLPEAHAVELTEAHLQGKVDQAALDNFAQDPTTAEIAKAIDDARKVLDKAAPFLALAPAPFGSVLGAVAKAVDVADDALSPLGL